MQSLQNYVEEKEKGVIYKIVQYILSLKNSLKKTTLKKASKIMIYLNAQMAIKQH